MASRDDVAGGLPDPTPYGPRGHSTQQDILDELGDHLECAAHSEHVRNAEADDRAVEATVLDRFGNPAAIARRLWWDAMKEQIMSNRMMMGTNVVLVVAVVVIGFVTVSSMQQNRVVTEALRAELALMAQQREQQSELADWSKINVRITPEAGRTDASGFEVAVRGEAFNPGTSNSITLMTDADGTATFGPLRPGSYTMTTEDDAGNVNQRTIVAYPGRENEVPLQWHPIETAFGDVNISLSLPDIIEDRAEFAVFSLWSNRVSRDPAEGSWSDRNSSLELWVDREGRTFVREEQTWPFVELGGAELHLKPSSTQVLADSVAIDSSRPYYLQSVSVYMAPTDESGVPDPNAGYREIRILGRSRRSSGISTVFDFSSLQNREFRARAGEATLWSIDLKSASLPRMFEGALANEGIFLPPDDS